MITFQAAEDSLAIAGVEEDLIACAFIVSRWDGSKWLRSTQFVKCNEEYLQEFTTPEARAAAIASYRGGDSVVSSDVYLNGGTGSRESAESGLIWEMLSISNKSHAGYCRLISVVNNEIGDNVVIQVQNIANGQIMTANVMWGIQGQAAYGRLLWHVSQNSWSFRAADADAMVFLPYTGSGRDPKLHDWFVANGIRA